MAHKSSQQFNMKKTFVMLMSVAMVFTYTKPSKAGECNLGGTLFSNMFYGGLIGAGVGGLVALANKDSKNLASRLATAGLIGIGTGGVIGVIQSSVYDCRHEDAPKKREKPDYYEGSLRFTPKFSYLAEPNIVTDTVQTAPVTFKQLQNNVGFGLQMTYDFPTIVY